MTTDNRTAGQGAGVDVEETIREEYDWSSTEPSTAVVEVVATASNCAPTATEPLYDAIDPDALDALVGSAETRPTDVTVEFAFAGYNVTVSSDDSVMVRPLPSGT